MTSSLSHRPQHRHRPHLQQHLRQQPAFVETDFTVPLTLPVGSPRISYNNPSLGGGADRYVIGSRDAARPAHTASGHASWRLGGHGVAPPPSMSRMSGSRPLISSHHAHSTYPPQRRDVGHPSPLSPHSAAVSSAFLLLPVPANASYARSLASSRQVVGSGTPGLARASGSSLHVSPAGSQHHYRTIQPKPAPPPSSIRYLPGAPVSPGMVIQPSRVTSDRRTSCPSFPAAAASAAVDWRSGESAPLLNIPRVPAAAHGSRPLPAAHRPAGMMAVGGRRSLSSLSGVDAALSLTIDDQAPLDCSRKYGVDNSVELDVPTVLNLTTSGRRRQ